MAPDPQPGEWIAEYELLDVLGKGGAGTVFRVRRDPGGEVLALKVLSASKVRRARIVQRFFDEVRAASAVEHSGLVRVLDFIEQESPRRLAYAMEYVPGEVLRARMKRERILDLRRSIQIGVQICEALGALHEAGIIHRDLKPENILLGETPQGGPPLVKLFDFGVVKFLPVDRVADLEREGRPGTFVGTPRYMAPEQAAGSGVDHRADLFALGVMLFEMITGRCPHEGDSLRDVVMAKLKGAPRITVNPEQEILPHELTDIVDRCLQLKPSLRPKDTREVASALRDAEVVLFTVGSMRATPEGTAVRIRSESTGRAPAEAARDDELGPRAPPPEPPPAGPPGTAAFVPPAPAGARRARLGLRHVFAGMLAAFLLAVAARLYLDAGERVVFVPVTLGELEGFRDARSAREPPESTLPTSTAAATSSAARPKRGALRRR